MDRILVDTGGWFAHFNAVDPDHSAVNRVLMAWEGRLLTSDYIFDELVTLVRYRVGHPEACRVGDVLRSGDLAKWVDVEPPDRDRAWRLFVRNRDKAYSFTDCTSFAIMDRLGIAAAVAVDADFRRAGYRVLPDIQI